MNGNLRNFALWTIIVLLMFAVFTLFQNSEQPASAPNIPLSQPPGDATPWYISLLVSWGPFLALAGVWVLLSRRMKKDTDLPAGQNPADQSRHMQNEIDALKRVIADQQAQIDRLSSKDR